VRGFLLEVIAQIGDPDTEARLHAEIERELTEAVAS